MCSTRAFDRSIGFHMALPQCRSCPRFLRILLLASIGFYNQSMHITGTPTGHSRIGRMARNLRSAVWRHALPALS